MKATSPMGAENTQKYVTYALGNLQYVDWENRQNFDTRKPNQVAEWRRLVGRTADEVYRLVVEVHKSPVYL